MQHRIVRVVVGAALATGLGLATAGIADAAPTAGGSVAAPLCAPVQGALDDIGVFGFGQICGGASSPGVDGGTTGGDVAAGGGGGHS